MAQTKQHIEQKAEWFNTAPEAGPVPNERAHMNQAPFAITDVRGEPRRAPRTIREHMRENPAGGIADSHSKITTGGGRIGRT